MSPSLFASLTACRRRVALGRSAPARSASPAAVIGTVCHEVLQAAIEEESLFRADWAIHLQELWDGGLASALARTPGSDLWGPPASWPWYNVKKARFPRLARRLRDYIMALHPTPELCCEKEFWSADGLLHGFADLVIRGPALHAVLDFKTGAVAAPGGEIHGAYRDQLDIYALLESEATGSWPAVAAIWPLEGPAVVLAVDAERATATGLRARALLAAYNGRAPEDQPAEPSAPLCRWCQVSPLCAPFWSTAAGNWAEEGLRAVRGHVEQVWHSPGRVGILVVAEEGTEGEARVVISRIDVLAHPHAQEVIAGDLVAAVGLRKSPEEQAFQLTDASVLHRYPGSPDAC